MVPSGYCPSPSSSGHVHVPACSPPSLRLSPESCCDRLDIYVKTHKSHQENDCYLRACNPCDITVELCKMGATHLLQQSLGRVLAANPGLNGNWTNDFLSLKWQAIIPGPLLDAFPISSLPEEPHYSLKEWDRAHKWTIGWIHFTYLLHQRLWRTLTAMMAWTEGLFSLFIHNTLTPNFISQECAVITRKWLHWSFTWEKTLGDL
jgi:hypothetical protein